MLITITVFGLDLVGLAAAKCYVARNFPGEGHVVTKDTRNADTVVTPETLQLEGSEADDDLLSPPFLENDNSVPYDFGTDLPDFTQTDEE